MERVQIFQTVRTIVFNLVKNKTKDKPLKETDVLETSELINVLKCNSKDLLQIKAQVLAKFEVDVPIEDPTKFKKVGDIVTYIKARTV